MAKAKRKSKARTWPFGHIVTLTAHPSGSWCKKIRGHLYYFGPLDQPEVALRRYQQIGPDLHEGRRPRVAERLDVDAVTVGVLVNLWLEGRWADVESGKLRPITWSGYHKAAVSIINNLGRHRLARDVGPADFEELLRAFGREGGPYTVSLGVFVCKTIFKWGHSTERLGAEPRFPPQFARPGRTEKKRASRAIGRRKNFTAAEVRRLLELCDQRDLQQLRAMILLGLNGGFGQTDCATLTVNVLRLDDAVPVIEYARRKTEVDRVVPLWPETVEALRVVLEQRRPAAADTDDRLVFLTHTGRAWVRELSHVDDRGRRRVVCVDSVANEFAKLRSLAEYPEGRKPDQKLSWPAFYGLRHTFADVADGAGDAHAVHRIRGHRLPGMSDVYVHRITVKRLKRVTSRVRRWLWRGATCAWPREVA